MPDRSISTRICDLHNAGYTSLSEKEWTEIVKKLADETGDYLHSFTLQTLGDLSFFGPETTHKLRDDNPLMEDGHFRERKGIISPLGNALEQPRWISKDISLTKHPLWLFTRTSEWVAVFLTIKHHYAYKGGPLRFEKVLSAETSLCQFSEIAARAHTTYEEMWKVLAQRVYGFATRRRQLLVEAEVIERSVLAAEQAMSGLFGIKMS